MTREKLNKSNTYCQLCHRPINLLSKYDGSFVKVEVNGISHYIHCDCYKDKKLYHSRPKWDIQTYNKAIKKLQHSTFVFIKDYQINKQLMLWIAKFYGFTSVPNLVNEKLQLVIQGNYKNMSKGIPLVDIYNIFLNIEDSLNQYNRQLVQRNALMGKSTDSLHLFYYDLTIVINKYDSYCEWKNENQIINKKIKQNVTDKKINYNALSLQHKDNKSEVDISDFIDDM